MVRRPRILQSWSQGGIGAVNHINEEPPVAYFQRKRHSAVNVEKPVKKAVPVKNPNAHLCTFTIGSPEKEEEKKNNNSWTLKKKKKKQQQQSGEGIEGFLRSCFLCKKKLHKDKDLYMYQYNCLGAFCSPDCRDDQIVMDGFEARVSKEAADLRTVAEQVESQD
ncbi:hypothetical protein K2173_021517 [Erythroxylum novogranatense]|uniref:FLZ-type domain-containing protein n=1 Tax=Erythroxylum novogranatense TaxID=1862640 RepID=A0AAV8TQJ4_9ROSI|nr:hypothetical protein K2173_021517 [Erythroxylum novogranatense]